MPKFADPKAIVNAIVNVIRSDVQDQAVTPFLEEIYRDNSENFGDALYQYSVSNGDYALTALMWACQTGKLAAVRWLLGKGAKFLDASQVRINELSFAAMSGNQALVQYLVEQQRMDVNVGGQNGSPLMHALDAENKGNVANYLLQKGALVDAVLINHLIASGKWDFVIVLANHAGINYSQVFLFHALTHAKNNDRAAVIKLLLSKNVNVDQPNQYGETPLMLALKQGDGELVEALLARNARVETKSQAGESALTIAYARNNMKAAQEIVKRLTDAAQIKDAWFLAAEKNDVASLEIIRNKKINDQAIVPVDATNARGYTALMVAVKYKQSAAITALVGMGANVNLARQRPENGYDSDGNCTAFGLAFTQEYPFIDTIVSSLLERGGDANVYQGSYNALQWAAHHGNLALMQQLMARNADLSKVVDPARQVINLAIATRAAENEKEAMVDYLLPLYLDEKKYPPAMLRKTLQSALSEAARLNNRNIAKKLIDCGKLQEEDFVDVFNNMYLSNDNQKAIARLLLDKISVVKRAELFDQSVSQGYGRFDHATAIFEAGQIDVVRKKYHDGKTALHYAAASDRGYDLMVLLIEAGADVNATDRHGQTPLMEAARVGKEEPVKLLLENGARLHERNNDNRTAYDYANYKSKTYLNSIIYTPFYKKLAWGFVASVGILIALVGMAAFAQVPEVIALSTSLSMLVGLSVPLMIGAAFALAAGLIILGVSMWWNTASTEQLIAKNPRQASKSHDSSVNILQQLGGPSAIVSVAKDAVDDNVVLLTLRVKRDVYAKLAPAREAAPASDNAARPLLVKQ